MIECLRARGIMTPVILVTGRVDVEGLARARTANASVLLTKPFDAATLFRALAAAVATNHRG
jgi:FixJ family two-component response regulator